jgi:hypothetical protein
MKFGSFADMKLYYSSVVIVLTSMIYAKVFPT